MPVINRRAIIPYSASQMYSLVNAVDEYADFLPWCSSTTVISQDEDEIRASITIAGGGIHKSFTTCNRLQRDKMIEIRLLDGPFKHLHGFWRFDDLDEKGSKITLDMEFEFAGKMLDFMFGPFFHQATNKLVDAFVSRAKVKYAK